MFITAGQLPIGAPGAAALGALGADLTIRLREVRRDAKAAAYKLKTLKRPKGLSDRLWRATQRSAQMSATRLARHVKSLERQVASHAVMPLAAKKSMHTKEQKNHRQAMLRFAKQLEETRGKYLKSLKPPSKTRPYWARTLVKQEQMYKLRLSRGKDKGYTLPAADIPKFTMTKAQLAREAVWAAESAKKAALLLDSKFKAAKAKYDQAWARYEKLDPASAAAKAMEAGLRKRIKEVETFATGRGHLVDRYKGHVTKVKKRIAEAIKAKAAAAKAVAAKAATYNTKKGAKHIKILHAKNAKAVAKLRTLDQTSGEAKAFAAQVFKDIAIYTRLVEIHKKHVPGYKMLPTAVDTSPLPPRVQPRPTQPELTTHVITPEQQRMMDAKEAKRKAAAKKLIARAPNPEAAKRAVLVQQIMVSKSKADAAKQSLQALTKGSPGAAGMDGIWDMIADNVITPLGQRIGYFVPSEKDIANARQLTNQLSVNIARNEAQGETISEATKTALAVGEKAAGDMEIARSKIIALPSGQAWLDDVTAFAKKMKWGVLAGGGVVAALVAWKIFAAKRSPAKQLAGGTV